METPSLFTTHVTKNFTRRSSGIRLSGRGMSVTLAKMNIDKVCNIKVISRYTELFYP